MRTTKKAKIFKPIKVEEQVHEAVRRLAEVRECSLGDIIKKLVSNEKLHE